MRIVRDLHRRFDIIYGDRLKGMYLYGSYARGDARDDSDIDVAIVLAGEVNRWNERKRTGTIVSDICLDEDCLIQTMFISEREFKEQPFDYHRSVTEEGIPV